MRITPEQLGLVMVVAGGCVVALFVVLWTAERRSPQERERRRRLTINRMGRLGDALITDVHDDTVFYNYTVRGVSYAASQEIGTLREFIPCELESLIGHASLKYATNNPANSILICEEWSGLRYRGTEVREGVA